MASTVKLVPTAFNAVDQRGYIVGRVVKDPAHRGKWQAVHDGRTLETNASTEEAREVIETKINTERTP